mmetsp:Transcript_140206/g.349464  ORF Transcript_140206/g.349464 Transcript_140206/m.349464 type:complete len:213 (+) Transcript_140206:772-1410(+)
MRGPSSPSSSPPPPAAPGVPPPGPPRQMRQSAEAESRSRDGWSLRTGAVSGSRCEEKRGTCGGPSRQTWRTESVKLPSLMSSPSLTRWPWAPTPNHMTLRLALARLALTGVRSTTGTLPGPLARHTSCVCRGEAAPSWASGMEEGASCHGPDGRSRTWSPRRRNCRDGPLGRKGTTRDWWCCCSSGASRSNRPCLLRSRVVAEMQMNRASLD